MVAISRLCGEASCEGLFGLCYRFRCGALPLQRMSPVLLSVAISHFEGDYETFQTHHDQLVPEAMFQNVASALKPLGKPVDVKYLGHLNKVEGIKLLWRVTYSDSKEELLWEFNIEIDGYGERIVSMGMDI